VDLVVIPAVPGARFPDAALSQLLEDWMARGMLGADGVSAGDKRDKVVEGGFASFRRRSMDQMQIIANQQGGFRVHCPESNQNISGRFASDLERWRAGGERSLLCIACGQTHALEHLVYSPPAGFSVCALEFSDVGSVRLSHGAQRELTQAIGAFQTIMRRVG